jgi:hypothetical protein
VTQHHPGQKQQIPPSSTRACRACLQQDHTNHIHTLCRFFPTAVYLSTSKLAVAAVGNLSFAMALAMYNLVIKVSCCSRPLHKLLTHSCNHALSQFLWLAGLLLAR